MTNPLTGYEQTTKTDVLGWCDEQNRKPLTAQMSRWYFVKEINGVERCEVIEGADGAAIHNYMDGVLPEYAGWDANRAKGYVSWLHRMAAQGVKLAPARA